MSDRRGCRSLTAFGGGVAMAVAAVAFVPTSGVSFALSFPAWSVIVAASLAISAAGLAAAIDRFAPPGSGPRGAATVLATIAVTALAAWSMWMALGTGATGTLDEAVPLIVDPAIAAVLAVALVTESRAAAVAAIAGAAVTVVIVGRFVAIVGPTYGG